MAYTQQSYQQLLCTLKELGEESFKAFNLKLIPGKTQAWGVRVPTLRRLAKQIAHEDAQGFLSIAREDTLEECMLQGMVIGAMRCSLAQRFALTTEFVPKIDNWAVCDVFCGDLKAIKKDLPAGRAFLERYECSDKEFELRFLAVMLMQYYTGDAYIDNTLKVYQTIRHEGYYVKMAIAWGLSVCFIKQREKTLPLLQNGAFDLFTHNKAIQKCCESRRVSPQDKALLRRLKYINPAARIKSV